MRAMRAIGLVLLVGCKGIGEGELGIPETPRPTSVEPMVRIGIKVDSAQVVLSSNSAAELLDRDGNVISHPGANESWTFTADDVGKITARNAAGQTFTTSATPLRFRAADNGFVTIGNRVYRGIALITATAAGRVSAINVVEMEKYLLGVVGFEIGHLKPGEIEATKAQAIAARTYAVGNMNSHGALGFDFYPTVADQVYGGTSGEDSVVTRAVMETRGEIIAHDGSPILAYYSSTCGGHTADVDESWPWRPPQPYLKGRPDTDDNGEAYCKTSNRFRWVVSWSRDTLKNVLTRTLGQHLHNDNFTINRVEDVAITNHTKSGRVEAIAIKVDGVTYRIPADSVRWVLRPTATTSLNSSLIMDLHVDVTNDEVTRLEVHGGGWGHGVGMCQVGAIGRARVGQSYRQILGAYYTDTEVKKLY